MLIYVEKYEFRGQLGAVYPWPNNGNRFAPRNCELPNNGFLARFTPPGLGFLLWLRPYIQSESDLLTPQHLCIITPMGISGHAGHFCSSQGSQLVRLLMTSLSPNSLHTTFQNEESQSRRSLPFDPNLIYPGFVTKMCDFFFFEVVSQIEFYPATTSNGNNLHYLRGL